MSDSPTSRRPSLRPSRWPTIPSSPFAARMEWARRRANDELKRQVEIGPFKNSGSIFEDNLPECQILPLTPAFIKAITMACYSLFSYYCNGGRRLGLPSGLSSILFSIGPFPGLGRRTQGTSPVPLPLGAPDPPSNLLMTPLSLSAWMGRRIRGCWGRN